MSVKWTPVVLVTGFVITIGTCVPMGYQLTVINTPEDIIRSWCNESIVSRFQYEMSKSQMTVLWSAIVSIFLIGGFTASFSGSHMADRHGRKGAVILSNVLGVASAILFVACRYANSVELLLLARFVVGYSAGLMLCTVPMYLTELGHVTQRGALGSLTQLGIAFGMLLGPIVGFDTILGNESLWHYLLAAHSVLIIVSSAALPFLPESPKYLYVIRGDKSGAIRELSRLRGLPAELLTEELQDLELNHKSEMESKHSLWSVAGSSELRMPLLLVVILNSGFVLSGLDSLNFYSTSLYKSIGLSTEVSAYATLGTNCVPLVMSLVAIYTVDRFGRRPLLLVSCFCMATCQVLLTITLMFSTATTWLPYLSIVTVVGFYISFYVGLASISSFIATELFVVGPSSVAMAYTGLCIWFMGFLVSMTYPTMREAMHDTVFLPYAFVMYFVGTFSWFYLPETKNRHPKDIAEMLKHGFSSKIKETAGVLAPVDKYISHI